MAIRIILSVVCVVVGVSASADVYRSVDEDGNVIFSDTQREGAEEVQLRETTVVPALKPPPQRHQSNSPAPNKSRPYETIGIASSANEDTVRDVQQVIVSVALAPGLQTRFGHKLQLYVDGERFGTAGTDTQFILPGVHRGEHALEVAVLDKAGRIIKRSESSIFFTQRHTVFSPSGG